MHLQKKTTNKQMPKISVQKLNEQQIEALKLCSTAHSHIFVYLLKSLLEIETIAAFPHTSHQYRTEL